MHAGCASQLQRVDIRPDRAARSAVCLDEQTERTPARHGFQPERAGACEQVNHARTFERRGPVCMGKDVKHRLARAVSGWPCAAPFRSGNRAGL